jgi:competence protein ComEC
VLLTSALAGALYYIAVDHFNHQLPLLSSLSATQELVVKAEGVIVSEPKVGGFYTSCELRLDWIAAENTRKIDAEKRSLYLMLPSAVAVSYGDRLKIDGFLRLPKRPRNPGQFDFPAWLALNGMLAQLNAQTVAVLENNQGNPIVAAALKSRDRIQQVITMDLKEDDPEIAGVISAMVLGTKEEAPDQLLQDFRYSGTMHIFAVSGLHVGMIGLILMELFKSVRAPRRVAALLVIIALIFYAFVTGLRPSAVRATVMATVILFGIVIDRQARLPNSLGIAALLILTFDPFQALMPGFQLSFAVLGSIALLTEHFSRKIQPLVSPDPFIPKALIPVSRQRFLGLAQATASNVAMSTAAWCGSTLLIVIYFHLVTPVAIVANIILVPMAFAVIYAAIVSLIFHMTTLSGIVVLINNANFLIVCLIGGFISLMAAIPGGHFFVTKPGILRDHCEIGVFDIPRGGGAAHIHTSTSARWQIDTGPSRSYRQILESYLQSKGLNLIDGLILTHADSNHTGAAPELSQKYETRKIVSNLVDKRSRSLTKLKIDQPLLAGQVIEIDHRTTLHVLFPPKGYVTPLANDRCAVIRLECDDWRVLFTGDAGFATERWLLSNCAPEDLRSDVMVRGLNTLGPSGELAFIKAVSPMAIVSSNSPRTETEKIPPGWKAMIRGMNIELFDQAEDGHVHISIHRKSLSLSGFVSKRVKNLIRE